MDNNLKHIIYVALFAALISIGSIISIPIGTVNLVLANFFIFLAGLLLGFPWAGVSVAVFLLIGLIGVPVFQGGSGGPAHFAGPTGGFLIGYLAAGFIIAFISGKYGKKLWKDILAVLAGIIIIYLIGLPWLKLNLDLSWTKTFAIGFLPFILIDLLKAGAAVLLAKNVSWLFTRNTDTAND